MRMLNLSYFTILILLPLFSYGQQPEVIEKSQLQIDFCDQVLEGDSLAALSTFQTLILKYNSNISEFILARGINLYDTLNTKFLVQPKFISTMEKLKPECSYLTKLKLEDCPPFSVTDINADYNDGISELFKKIGNKLSLPECDSTETLSTKSFVQFTVQPDGSISNVKIIKGENSIEEQITQILTETSGQWSPGRCNCHVVASKMIIPISIHRK